MIQHWSNSFFFFFAREIEYLKKETQRCAQVGAEASALTEESGELQEQVDEATKTVLQNISIDGKWLYLCMCGQMFNIVSFNAIFNNVLD